MESQVRSQGTGLHVVLVREGLRMGRSGDNHAAPAGVSWGSPGQGLSFLAQQMAMNRQIEPKGYPDWLGLCQKSVIDKLDKVAVPLLLTLPLLAL